MCAADPLASVRSALDRAIAEVAEAEYGRLAHGVPLDTQAKRVDAALQSLGRLKQGTPPDYDSEWVVLFYVTWYQPRQVHLAYATLPPVCLGEQSTTMRSRLRMRCLGSTARAGHRTH